tara:strand:+ start:1668 stop:2672 length:1005 start_codon:yes stop_codon:yes gene_type:complete
MSDAQTYYDGLISQGYTSDQAVTYTQQYYSDFQPTPVVSTELVAPTPTVSAPISTPEVTPSLESEQGGIDIMAIAAVVCIALALILSVVGQFNGSWLSSDEDDTHPLPSSGLRTVTLDCSDAPPIDEFINGNQTTCMIIAKLILAEGWRINQNPPPEQLVNLTDEEGWALIRDTHGDETTVSGLMSNFCTNSYEFGNETLTSYEEWTGTELPDEHANLSADLVSCQKGISAGLTGGIVLWAGTFVALTALVFAILGMVGVSLPGGIESHGKWVSLVSGVLMILAVLVWYLMLPSSEDSAMGASIGIFITVFAAILAIVSGALGIVGGMSKSNEI